MKLKKTITVLVAAFALALGGASAAVAAPGYTPVLTGGPTTITPGGSGTFTYSTFDGNEPVTFTLTGENGAGATLAASAAVTSPSTTQNASNGVVSVAVPLPANATGTYTLVAAAASGTVTTAIASGIAATGADVSPLLIWGAVGAVGLGVIALIAVSAARRSRQAQLVEHA